MPRARAQQGVQDARLLLQRGQRVPAAVQRRGVGDINININIPSHCAAAQCSQVTGSSHCHWVFLSDLPPSV